MRSDYALYAVAIIFFILTAVVSVYSMEQKQLWIITTAVLGLAFIGIGYSQRPKHTLTTTIEKTATAIPPPPPPPTQTTTTQVAKAEKTEPTVQATLQGHRLTRVKGIGEKRALQLKALGINTAEDLASASGKDLAAKLKISPKITGKWVENAKEIAKKS